MKKYICLFMILTTLISAFFIGCQKNTNQLEKVDIIVNSENETIDKNTNSVSVNFTVNNNSNKYIVVSYFDDVYGESYLTVFSAIMSSIALFIKIYLVDVRNIGYIMLLPIALIVMLYVPTIYLFNCALTMGALCVNVFFAMIAYTAIMIGLINMKELF